MRVIGTAGHVDHGKSTLIAALTGTHPDRLKEERAREMTIDLGFAWMSLPDGEPVGIVDVPGHRDFIENMLAGVGGIDAALFVVAADEGVMPQTREHLAILDILQIPAGIIVLTKIDLFADPDWLDLVEADIRQTVAGTVLETAPLVRVSARTRAGLPELIQTLAEVLGQHPARPDLGRPRLPIDRVFTIAGFGTVVTGTLTDGRFHTGEEVEILPSGLKGRIRGLQSYSQKEEIAFPGSRTAINISGVDVDQVARGEVVAQPGQYIPSRRIDVQFRLLASASAALKHSTEVKFFLGAAEIQARVRLLGTEELQPGETGWLQLELLEPAVALRGDHYILRRPSPGETLGGGIVLDPHPRGRHKRFASQVIEQLETYLAGAPDEVLFQASLASGLAPVREVIARARLDPEQGRQALAELIERGDLINLEEGTHAENSERLVIARPQWQALGDQVESLLRAYHRSYPLRPGIPREELKSRLKLTPRIFNTVLRRLVQTGLLSEDGGFVRHPEHRIRLTPPQEARLRSLLGRIAQNPYTPPSVKEMQAELGEDVYDAALALGELVQVSSDVAFRRQDYDALLGQVRAWLGEKENLTVAEFRDRYQTSRRYALAFLEHLDQSGVTVRDGDLRRLKK
ncbi:MAG TPA: selenocysteine-specific translation elongation factor [Anaerolineaceae bacterium]